jgi:hypothetical protein
MNQETYPASLFPLRGDISAESGQVIVEVTGLQNIPIAPNPLTDGAVPTYVALNNDIEWLVGSKGSSVSINGVGQSNDYLILLNTAFTINFGSDTFLGVRINGVRDGG